MTDATPAFTWTADASGKPFKRYWVTISTSAAVDDEGELSDEAESCSTDTATELTCSLQYNFGLPTDRYYWQVLTLNSAFGVVTASAPVAFQAQTGRIGLGLAPAKRWGSAAHPKGIRIPLTTSGTLPVIEAYITIRHPKTDALVFTRTVRIANPTPGTVLKTGVKWRRPARLRAVSGRYPVRVYFWGDYPNAEDPEDPDTIYGTVREHHVRL